MMGHEKIIASLTSFPLRITTVHRVVESILNQSVRPDRVVLYLADVQFPGRELPDTIVELMRKRPEFEVRWWPRDIRSYKKLVPALIEFPDDPIVTFDDDILYPPDIVERLLKAHRKHPDAVCGCRVRLVAVKDGAIRPYREWRRCKKIRLIFRPGAVRKFRTMATTGGGTLFPPRCLHPDAVRDDVFMELCPTTDDLWFWAMAVLGGATTVQAGRMHRIKVIGETQARQLADDNIRGRNLNDRNVERIFGRYPEVGSRVIGTL